MSSTVLVSSRNIIDNVTNSTFRFDFNAPISLADKEIALVSTSIYYSWRNITEDNNVLTYTWVDGNVYTITLPIGFYEISDITAYCQYVWRNNGHYLQKVDKYIYYMDIVVNPTNYSCDIITYPVPSSLPSGFTNPSGNFVFSSVNNTHPIVKLVSKINEILGFDEMFSTSLNNTSSVSTVYSSSNAPNINPNSSLTVICDECHNEFFNLGVLYNIVPTVGIGSLFVDRPSHPVYLPLKSGVFNSLTFRLVNSNTMKPMNILDPTMNFLFSIKKKGI
jgi:hypothetical protein